MRYRDALKRGQEVLKDAGILEADVDAWLLFSQAYSLSRAGYFLEQTHNADEEKTALYFSYIKKRTEHVPVQYILSSQDFFGHTFYVDEHVLIPRLDTEVLVDTIIQKRNKFSHSQSFLDLCTGSGCIAISLILDGPFIKGVATDLSLEALMVARKNAASLKAEGLSFMQGDLWEAVKEGEKYDVIVSNPPYISYEEEKDLDPEVLQHEPHMALFALEDGLLFYRRIIENAGKHLLDGGQIFFEIGCTQAKKVSMLLENAKNEFGYFDQIEVVKDLAGLDRVVLATYHRTDMEEICLEN